jgi:hypothetical protein
MKKFIGFLLKIKLLALIAFCVAVQGIPFIIDGFKENNLIHLFGGLFIVLFFIMSAIIIQNEEYILRQ